MLRRAARRAQAPDVLVQLAVTLLHGIGEVAQLDTLAVGQQQREGDPVIVHGGEVQCGLAKVRVDVHRGSVIEQPADRLRPSVSRGPVERRPELVAL